MPTQPAPAPGIDFSAYQPLVPPVNVTPLLHSTGGTLIDRLKNPDKTAAVRMSLQDIRNNRLKASGQAENIGGDMHIAGLTPPGSPDNSPAAPTDTPPPAKEGFWSGLLHSVVKGVATPFLRLGNQGAEAYYNTKLSAQEGIANLMGDKAGAQSYHDQKDIINMGFAPGGNMNQAGNKDNYLGSEIKPITNAKEAFGNAMQIGSTLGATDLVKGIAANTFRGAVLNGVFQGAASGGLSGFLGGAGSDMANNKNSNLVTTAISGAAGGIGGAIAGGVLGGIGGAIGAGVRKAASTYNDWRISHQEVADAIAGLPPEEQAARAAEVVQSQQAAANAVKKDISPLDATYIAQASPEDKAAFQKMYQIADEATKKGGPQPRTIEVPGRTFIDQAQTVEKARAAVGAKIGQTIQDLPKQPIDVTSTYDDLMGTLQANGVTLKADGSLDFQDSAIAATGSSGDQKVLQDLVRRLTPNKDGKTMLSPQSIGVIRQWLGNEFAGKEQVFTPYVDTIANGVRVDLKKPLVELSPGPDGYEGLSGEYSTLKTTLKDFFTLMGKQWKGDMSGDPTAFGELRAGEVGNRLMGNASSQTLKTLSNLEDVSKAYGFNENVSGIKQQYFSDFLENLFGNTQTRSLSGSVTKGINEAVGAAKDAATHNWLGLAGKLVERVRGITPEAQKEAVRALIGLTGK